MKYNTLEELRNHLKENNKKWFENLSDDKKQIYKERYGYKNWLARQDDEKKQEYKNKTAGYCDACGRKYSNIYTHKKSKKHIKNMNNILEN